jgi:hypothetical protein
VITIGKASTLMFHALKQGKGDENVMKVRLADYLGIGLPSDTAADTDDDDTVDATGNGGV